MKRGDIRWYTFGSPDKRRPVLVLSRSEVASQLNEIVVVPITRTIRDLETEVLLGKDDGMPVSCVLNFDHVSLAQRPRLGALIATLPPDKWPTVRDALLVACGFAPEESS
jgi:mRNA interferase MazF